MQISQRPELQLARAKVEGIVYKLIKRMPQSFSWENLGKHCQAFSPVATEMHASIWIYSRLQTVSKTLQE